jgi:hypothetical protein
MEKATMAKLEMVTMNKINKAKCEVTFCPSTPSSIEVTIFESTYATGERKMQVYF